MNSTRKMETEEEFLDWIDNLFPEFDRDPKLVFR